MNSDFSNASEGDLLDALVDHAGEGLNPPNSSWLRRYYELSGEHYAFVEGFAPDGGAAWIPYETYEEHRDDEDLSTTEEALRDEVNADGPPQRPPQKQHEDFVGGYLAAVQNLVTLHDQPSMAVDLLKESGFSRAMLLNEQLETDFKTDEMVDLIRLAT